MNSGILTAIGLGGIDPAVFIVLFLLLIIVLFVLVILQNKKYTELKHNYDIFMAGKTARSMEAEIMDLFKDIRYLLDSNQRAEQEIEALKLNSAFAHQKMGLVRYDAFREMGGKLSFSLAILDDKNNGFLLNSVHSTDGCYTYTKEIVNGEAFITLGEEEQEALQKALSADTHPAPKQRNPIPLMPETERRDRKKKPPVKKSKKHLEQERLQREEEERENEEEWEEDEPMDEDSAAESGYPEDNPEGYSDEYPEEYPEEDAGEDRDAGYGEEPYYEGENPAEAAPYYGEESPAEPAPARRKDSKYLVDMDVDFDNIDEIDLDLLK